MEAFVQNVEESTGRLAAFTQEDQLLPCVVQEDGTGQILMLAYINEEALVQSLRTRKATFFSRKRQKLWVKGETSGNYLRICEILLDCDQDSFVYKVERRAGGACHTQDPKGSGNRISCFYRRLTEEGVEFI